MATIYWRGDAPAVAQVNTFSLAGTWEADDVINFTVGGKTVSLVAGSTNTTTIAALMATTWNALSSSLYPEFAELTATSSTADFILTADTAGKPFTCTIATTETGGGAADSQTIDGGASSTGVATTANEGPNDWSTAENWSAGAVPVNSDIVFVQNSDVDILYGLSQGGVTVTALYIDQSYTGKIGLPPYNEDGTAYREYRTRYLTIGATTTTIGRGEGTGSARINLDNSSVTGTVNVLNSGSPTDDGRLHAIQWKGTDSSNVMEVNRGTVAVAPDAGETATLATLSVGYVTNVAGDSTVRCGVGTTLTTINQSGGTLTTQSNVTTMNQTSGEFIHLAGTLTTLNLDRGDCRYQSSGTLTTALVGSGGNLDFRQDSSARTVTNITVYEGFELHDPAGTVTWTNGIDFARCTPADGVFDVVPNRTWTPSAI